MEYLLLECVPARAETLVSLIEVPLHRGPGSGRLTRSDRVYDRAMLGKRRIPQLLRVIMVLELLIQWAGPLFPEHLYDLNQRAVARAFRDAQMKQAVRVHRGRRDFHLLLHHLQRFLHRRELRLFCRAGGERRAFSFDDRARAEQFERTGERLMLRTAVAVARGIEHVDAGADANLDQALDLQRNQTFANRRPGHPELTRQIPLRRQARSRRKLARAYQRSDLVGDLPIEPAGLDTLNRHGRNSLNECRLRS